MLKLQSPLNNGDNKSRQKSGRKPLQPKNSESSTNSATGAPVSKSKQGWIQISVAGDSNKENNPMYATPMTTKLLEPLDASLAEELSAVKQKLERLRLDKERTEKILKEREAVLDLRREEILQRGEAQKRLEIEVDRLYRLKQLQSYTMRISSIRSLREKEDEKKLGKLHLQINKKWVDCSDTVQEMVAEDLDGSVDGNVLQGPSPSPTSSWGSNTSSPQPISTK